MFGDDHRESNPNRYLSRNVVGISWSGRSSAFVNVFVKHGCY